jgi:GrpB-like predicted nucleotidyltransferase (UPF0157 family)
MQESVTHDGSRWSNADDDRVEVKAYDPDWPAKFAVEAAAIRSEVGEAFDYAIEHVGSTAVPGLAAKPIIDIVLAVPDRERWRELVAPLERLGYSYWASNPDPDAMFFVKGMPPFGSKRTHHVHVRTAEAIAPLVLFRNFLRANPAEARRYGELKRDLAIRFERDREAYSAGKAEFVEAILQKAAGPKDDGSPG